MSALLSSPKAFRPNHLPVIRTSSVSIPFIRSRSDPSRSQILKIAIDRTSDSLTEQIWTRALTSRNYVDRDDSQDWVSPQMNWETIAHISLQQKLI